MAKKKIKKPAKKITKKTTKKAVKKSVKKKTVKKAAKKPAPKAEKKSTVINPYLTFNGTCEEAFNFYRSVFGGKFSYVGKFGEMPSTDGKPIPESEREKIMHISLPVSKETILMGSDSSEAFGQVTVTGNNFSISITASSKNEADRLYNGLSANGTPTMPMSSTFWGSYFGMLTDKFGIQWMVSYDQSHGK